MSTYTDLNYRRKENLTVLRLPGCPNDGMTPQKVQFMNGENIYNGTFIGNLSSNGAKIANATLVDATISGGHIVGADIDGFDVEQFSTDLEAAQADIQKLNGEYAGLKEYTDGISAALDDETKARISADAFIMSSLVKSAELEKYYEIYGKNGELLRSIPYEAKNFAVNIIQNGSNDVDIYCNSEKIGYGTYENAEKTKLCITLTKINDIVLVPAFKYSLENGVVYNSVIVGQNAYDICWSGNQISLNSEARTIFIMKPSRSLSTTFGILDDVAMQIGSDKILSGKVFMNPSYYDGKFYNAFNGSVKIDPQHTTHLSNGYLIEYNSSENVFSIGADAEQISAASISALYYSGSLPVFGYVRDGNAQYDITNRLTALTVDLDGFVIKQYNDGQYSKFEFKNQVELNAQTGLSAEASISSIDAHAIVLSCKIAADNMCTFYLRIRDDSQEPYKIPPIYVTIKESQPCNVSTYDTQIWDGDFFDKVDLLSSRSGSDAVALNLVENADTKFSIQVPRRSKLDVDEKTSREFIIAAKIDSTIDKLLLQLVDEDPNIDINYVNAHKKNSFAFATNKWTTLQFNEINNNLFYVRDLDESDLHDDVDVLSNNIDEIWKNIRGGLNYQGNLEISTDLTSFHQLFVDNNIPDDIRLRNGFYYVAKTQNKQLHYRIEGVEVEHGDWLIINKNSAVSSITSADISIFDAQDYDTFRLSADNVANGNNAFYGSVWFENAAISNLASATISLETLMYDTGLTSTSNISSVADLTSEFDARIESAALSIDGISSELSNSVRYFGTLSNGYDKTALNDFLRANFNDENYQFHKGYQYRISADLSVGSDDKHLYLFENDYITFNTECILANVTLNDIDIIRDAQGEGEELLKKLYHLSGEVSGLSGEVLDLSEDVSSLSGGVIEFNKKIQKYENTLSGIDAAQDDKHDISTLNLVMTNPIATIPQEDGDGHMNHERYYVTYLSGTMVMKRLA